VKRRATFVPCGPRQGVLADGAAVSTVTISFEAGIIQLGVMTVLSSSMNKN